GRPNRQVHPRPGRPADDRPAPGPRLPRRRAIVPHRRRLRRRRARRGRVPDHPSRRLTIPPAGPGPCAAAGRLAVWVRAALAPATHLSAVGGPRAIPPNPERAGQAAPIGSGNMHARTPAAGHPPPRRGWSRQRRVTGSRSAALAGQRLLTESLGGTYYQLTRLA